MDGGYPRIISRDWIAPARQDAGMVVGDEGIFF
jgi:hypothetical protein